MTLLSRSLPEITKVSGDSNTTEDGMKLKVFLNTDKTEITSVKVVDFRTIRIARPDRKSKAAWDQILSVTKCEIHDGREPTIKVPAFAFSPGHDGTPCGIAKVCILCWALLEIEA